jgi:hypothetical protein
MRDCTVCGKPKDESEFYSGFVRCKQCVSAYQKAYREKQNANKPADWKQKTKDKKAYQREWLAKRPGYGTELKRKWYNANRDRLRVKWAVKDALKAGKIQKLPCLVCGEIKVEAHHTDYSRPIDIVWLCKPHHIELHVEHKRRIKNGEYKSNV